MCIYCNSTQRNQNLSCMSRVTRKAVFGFSNLVRHKPNCTATEDGKRLEISYQRSRGIVLHNICGENKGANLRLFVFAYHAKSRFSHDVAQIQRIQVADLQSIIKIQQNIVCSLLNTLTSMSYLFSSTIIIHIICQTRRRDKVLI